MWLRSFRSGYLEAVLELLWRQWTTLGVFGQRGYMSPGPIDPEALITATILFGRYEPRVFDGAIEWWLRNSEWLSSTRLQKLREDLAPLERRTLAAVTDSVLSQQKPKKWQRLMTDKHDDLVLDQPTPVFLLRDGKPLPQVGAPDPIFLRFGLLRPRFETRQMSEKVPLDLPANLRIRLRAFFGVNSRAEIALYLLTHESSHPRLVARQTCYAVASISTALSQIGLSGLVSSRRFGREVEYKIDRRNWQKFFGLSKSVPWVNWVLVFQALREVWECLEHMKGRKVTMSVLGSELRRCARKANRMLYKSELGFAFPEDEPVGFEEYPGVFANDIKRLFEALGVAS